MFEPPDLLQTRMNGGDQIVVEADQILRHAASQVGKTIVGGIDCAFR